MSERAADEPCRQTPSTCMDDLCRNSDIGLCGNVDDDPFDEEDQMAWTQDHNGEWSEA